MIYLLLAIICSSCITLVLKAGDKHCQNRYAMLSVNYLVCVIMALIFMPKDSSFSVDSHSMVLFLGVINGVLFLVCMVYNQINVTKNGAILTSTFVRLGVMVPTLLSIFIFGETPTLLQVLGIILVGVAFIIMSKGNSTKSKISFGSLIILLLLGGITDSMSKIFNEFCPIELDDFFLLFTFFIALVICSIVAVIKRQKFTYKECIMGVAMGVPNYLSTLFLIQSLSRIKAFIAYPTYSVGTIFVVILVSFIAFKEKLSKWQIVSVGFIILALVMLNIK